MVLLRRALPVLLLLTAPPLHGASLDEAWRLFLEGEHDAAARQAAEVSADEGQRAGALNLLGSIAFEQGRCGSAREHWAAAAELGGIAGREAALKLALLSAAPAGCASEFGGRAAPPVRGALPDPDPSEPAPAAADPAQGERPAAGSPPAPPIAAAPPAGAQPVSPSAGRSLDAAPPPPSASAPTAGEPSSLVLVAGKGTPFDEVRRAVERVTAFLRAQGIEAESPTEKIAVVQESEVVLAQLLSAARDRGAAGVVLIDVRFGHRERVEATCYDPQGGPLFEEGVTGGMGLVRPVRMNETLMERIEERLASHIGGPCLPVAR